MKLAALFAFALLAAACGGKSKPMATTPAEPAMEAAPGGDEAGAASADDESGDAKAAPPAPDQTDPCGGDE